MKLVALLALVLVLHALALEWLARQDDSRTRLPELAPTMYTRLLQPATPPPVVPQEAAPAPKIKPRAAFIAPRPRPKASEPQPTEVARAPEPPAAEETAPAVPESPPSVEGAAPQPAEPASAAVAPDSTAADPAALPRHSRESGNPGPDPFATAPEGAASAPSTAPAPLTTASAPPADLSSWPSDTRLSYQLTGEYRGGPLFGDARVFWQREGDRYQVRLDAAVKVLGRTAISQTLTSQGEVTPQGLLPRAYEEFRPGKRRGAEFGDTVLSLENGKTAPRPPGLQDTASQFVELGHRFATGRERLEVGGTVTFWMARPGAVDQWTYDIVAREIVRTPGMGDVEAFHLKPRPMANPRGNITAEMWFAPSLQYLPVRIKVLMGELDYLDLRVDKIEQR
ncbi:MAG TPA: DUF3108 domain-containing protein [Ramlibacter sp.]|nr:DUF3108 domain-containing protein [Ramlibacter sp.]